MRPLEGKQDFTKIRHGDPLFDPIPPMTASDWDIIKTNIQSNSEKNWDKFLPKCGPYSVNKILLRSDLVTFFLTIYKDKFLSKFEEGCLNIVALRL